MAVDPRQRSGDDIRQRAAARVSLASDIPVLPPSDRHQFVVNELVDPASWFGPGAYVYYITWIGTLTGTVELLAPDEAWTFGDVYVFAGDVPSVDFPSRDAADGSNTYTTLADASIFAVGQARPAKFNVVEGSSYTVALSANPVDPAAPLGTMSTVVQIQPWWTPDFTAFASQSPAWWYRSDTGIAGQAGDAVASWAVKAPYLSSVWTLPGDHTLTSDDSANDPVLGTSYAEFSASASMSFTQSSTPPSSAFPGFGFRSFFVFTPEAVSGTLLHVTDEIPFHFYKVSWDAAGIHLSGVGNGGDELIGDYPVTLTIGQLVVVEVISRLDGASLDIVRVNGSVVANTAVPANSGQTLTMSVLAAGVNKVIVGPGAMRVRELFFCNAQRTFTDGENAAIRSYYSREYGVSV